MNTIPFDQWRPLSVREVVRLFKDAPFRWALAGGYAIEQFLGKSIREHKDIDVLIFRDDQLLLQGWLTPNWQLYAADPPGTLRTWRTEEFLPFGIHDIWAHQCQVDSWQLQVMLMESDSERWYSRRNSKIGGMKKELIVQYGGVPCICAEVQLLFKSKDHREKDDIDFAACSPELSDDARLWLRRNLQVLYPDGHPWIEVE